MVSYIDPCYAEKVPSLWLYAILIHLINIVLAFLGPHAPHERDKLLQPEIADPPEVSSRIRALEPNVYPLLAYPIRQLGIRLKQPPQLMQRSLMNLVLLVILYFSEAN